MSTSPRRPGSHRGVPQLLIASVALAHSVLFIVYQRPDWLTEWRDQTGYLLLGRAIAETGRFTRFPAAAAYVPEPIRTPAYPAFVALVDVVFGEHHLAIAGVQAVLFAITCLLVFAIARHVVSDRVALAAGLVTALYPPFPYYGALVLTETLTTTLVTAAVAVWLRALGTHGAGAFVASGVLFAAAALTRPSFQFLPLFMIAAALAASLAGARGQAARPWRGALVMLGAFMVAVAPWIAYNAVYFHALTFSPAGGPGRQLFDGFWQAELPGRVEAQLTSIATDTPDRLLREARARQVAAQSRLPPELVVSYVQQFADIRHIWLTPTEPNERVQARIVADHEYLRVGFQDIQQDFGRFAWGRLTRGAFVLWAAEIPVRYSDINRLPPLVIRLIWLPQVCLVALAVVGVVVMARAGALADAFGLAALLLYVTAFHLPISTEARYSLPAKPAALLLAVVAVAGLARKLPPSQLQA